MWEFRPNAMAQASGQEACLSSNYLREIEGDATAEWLGRVVERKAVVSTASIVAQSNPQSIEATSQVKCLSCGEKTTSSSHESSIFWAALLKSRNIQGRIGYPLLSLYRREWHVHSLIIGETAGRDRGHRGFWTPRTPFTGQPSGV